MAISVSFHLTKFERFIIIGNYLFETITRIFSKNSIYPEIVLKESEYNKIALIISTTYHEIS